MLLARRLAACCMIPVCTAYLFLVLDQRVQEMYPLIGWKDTKYLFRFRSKRLELGYAVISFGTPCWSVSF